ncbi:MAG: CHAT domain-containing protein [Deltaproteobacteria bacterium]|nr:CHAT domain-containing protein [Deltaproteobacteria bacterium]
MDREAVSRDEGEKSEVRSQRSEENPGSSHHSVVRFKVGAAGQVRKGKGLVVFVLLSLVCVLLLTSLFSACVIPGLPWSFTQDRTPVTTSVPDPFVRQGIQRLTPRPIPVHRPVQVTFEADPVLYASLSGDGRKLVYTVSTDGPSSLWLRTVDPSKVELPQRLVQGVGRITAPAISRDGRKIAFTATEHDAKGDIYLLTPGADDRSIKRLTGRETQDGAPAFSPDGHTLYFHRSRTGQTGRQLAVLDLRQERPAVQTLDAGGDGAFPAISPDGQQCAFVSRRNDPAGDIFVLHLRTGRVTPVTQGPTPDLYPSWSPDGRYIYFSCFAADTTGDGRVTPEDHAVICRVDASGSDPLAYPLTSEAFSALQPLATPSGLSFLSTLRGTGNLWHLPLEGMIPHKKNARAQLELARTLADRGPGDDRLAVLAFYKVLETFPDQGAAPAQAAYEMGNLYQQMGRPLDAERAYNLVLTSYGKAMPEAPLARIRLEGMGARKAWKAAFTEKAKSEVLKEALRRIDALARPNTSSGHGIPDAALARIRARSLMEQARLLTDLGNNPDAFLKALKILDRVSETVDIGKSMTAEALFLQARLNRPIGRAGQVAPAFEKVIEDAPDTPWADRSVEQMIDTTLSDPALTTEATRIEALSHLARTYRKTLPKITMGAFNRMGDLAFARGDWRQAKIWYGQVLTEFPQRGRQTATQRAAARLALAETLYREELFREALDLYQTEMQLWPEEDRLYRLARAAYIQKSLAAADFLFQLGEVPGAQNIYAGLIREDPGLVQAHRGYIKCAAAKKEMGPTQTLYRSRMARAPDDPVTLYSVGLCLTYVEGKDNLEKARSLIQRAIEQQGQVEYFHQTLGYIYEVLETVYHQPGHLEKALESYQKAYFLNRPEQDPRNAANLALNLGNIHFLLGQYGKALERYLERLDAKIPFDHPDTEILFYRRLGAAAFQVRDLQRPITAFQKAIALIDKRIDPRRPSEILGKINDTIRDRILIPALKRPDRAKAAESLAQRQAAINQKLFAATTRPFGPPPDPRWDAYRDALNGITDDQEAIIRDMAPLIQEKREETIQTLAYMLIRAREALGFPKAMVQLKAEMLDRLGLAFQEAGQWHEAGVTFEKAFLLNKSLGQVYNLAANQRSVAYSKYMAAGSLTGEARTDILREAARDFRQVEDLLKQYGTIDKESKKGGAARPGQALLNLSVGLSLNRTDASKAMYGFNAEQERRLAQAFISRIETELGEIATAEDAVVKQLELYPPGKPIADGDLYGVSLLTHRGGQLSYALRRPLEAFERFHRSALLSLKLNNPVSSALNVENMALALARIPARDSHADKCRIDLMTLDRQTTRLLRTFSEVLGPLVATAYHNILGVFILEDAAERGQDSLENAAHRVNALAEAGTHFSEGLAWLARLKGPKSRKALGLEAALHLNMARVAEELGQDKEQKAHSEKALQLAQKGRLPQYAWRALAGLGDLEAALSALDRVSLFETGCGPGEILNAFSPMVSDLIHQGKNEAALNLLERLSETERFHRLRPLILGRLTEPEDAWLDRVLPKLMTLTRLEADLQTAAKEAQPHLRERINQERQLIGKAMGERGERVPSQVGLARSQVLQEGIMILLGLAVKARQTADAAVDQGPGPQADALNKEYEDSVRSYQKEWKVFRKRARSEGVPGLAAIFGPDPVEAIDLMEGLPAGWTAVRLFKTADQGSPKKAFIVTPEVITIREPGPDGAIPESKEDNRVIVYEDPSALPASLNRPLALNATHLVRSIENRKPFRRQIIAIASDASPPPPFEVTSLPAAATENEIMDALPGAQGLLFGGPLFAANPVPTRPGEVPSPYLAMGLDKGRALPLTHLSGRIPDVSLALLQGASMADAYPLGHLFAMLGVPTIVMPRQPQPGSQVIGPFFKAYVDAPVHQALVAAENEAGKRGAWVSLGYWGMTGNEALSLAKKRFKQYVSKGVQAFKGRDPLTAMVSFDKALNVARQTRGLHQYLPQLFAYARESAYAAGRYREAEQYARALAEMLAKKRPDTREHAEALIRLGLVQARMEKYDQAIPVLEEGAEIMANLELGAPQVAALNDLGVVLENATDYDRALARFRSAASLSKAMNKEELLAQQHMRMGRIYDLRLSQYAKAKEHYMSAEGLYEALGQKQSMAQALLDTGRCDRLLGDFKGASRNYQQALALLTPGEGDLRLRANIRMEMANNDWFQAQYQDAFKGQKAVLDQARKNQWDLEQVNALNTSGLIWWTLGNHDRALRDLEDALALAKTLKARQDEVATTLNNMGLVYRDQGAYEKALKALDEALLIDTKLHSRWAMAYDLKNQAITYLRMGKPEAALPLFEKALQTAQEIGNRINQAKILAAYGDALATMGRTSKADKVYFEALDLSRAMALRETEWRALFGLARLRLQQKEREAAQDLLSRAVDVIEDMRADIKLDRLKDGFIANKMDVYETLVSLLVDMGRESDAFQVAERSRARNLIDLLGNQRLSLHGAINQEMYDREKTLKARISEYETLLAQSREEGERAVYGRALKRTRDAHRDLMLEIQMKNPQLTSILTVQPLTLSQVQEQLAPGVALLAYYVVPDEILCWRITREKTDLFRTPVGRKALRESILDYRRALQNLEPVNTASQQLYTWLMSGPGAGLEGIKAVGIVPHDALHHLAFATLFDGKDYMVDRFPLFSLPSASVLRYTLKRRAEEKNTRVLAVGNPDLENPSLDLPFAEREVGAIGWNFPDITVLTGKQATEGWVVRNISDFGIIHLASHGEFDPVNPLFSAVKLAKDDPYDGDLKASEIFGLDIQAGLVVLSACQTGLGKVSKGDDVIGMNRAFLYAGTHAVISSLWRVSDITTAILVKQFYREYKTEPTAQSLQKAMRHVKNRYPHPGYWGAFVLVGDYM